MAVSFLLPIQCKCNVKYDVPRLLNPLLANACLGKVVLVFISKIKLVSSRNALIGCVHPISDCLGFQSHSQRIGWLTDFAWLVNNDIK